MGLSSHPVWGTVASASPPTCMKLGTIFRVVQVLFLASFLTSALGQDVSIPDPGLNAAIRDTLGKPSGPLSQPDLLSLTNLNASRRNVESTVALEAPRNLVSLDLRINQLTNFPIPTTFSNLSDLTLSYNPL